MLDTSFTASRKAQLFYQWNRTLTSTWTDIVYV